MRSQPREMVSRLGPAGVAEWAATQCLGLAEALHAFHKSPYKRKSDFDPRTHGLHADIKPKNILWYRNWHSEGEEWRRQRQRRDGRKDCSGTATLGTLQITDFSLASYHHPHSASLVDHPAVQLTYRPPEPELGMVSGPSFDIWSLACLYFDFLVWMLEGYEALDQFRKARSHPTGGAGGGIRTDNFYEISQCENGLEVGISAAIYDVREPVFPPFPEGKENIPSHFCLSLPSFFFFFFFF